MTADTNDAVKIGSTALALCAGVAAFAVLGDSWWQLAVAAYFAVVFAQLGFIGHDAGHGQIRRGARANALIGVIHANALIGLSYGWWNDKHNRHHAHPNEPDRDPDVDAGALVFTVQAAAGRRGLGRVLVRYQAWYFLPLLLLQAASLHVNSIIWLLRQRRVRWGEVVLLAMHIIVYVTALLLVLSPAQALVFAVVHQGLLGVYLGCAFAPNHKGMPIATGRDASSFLRRQVLSSRNVRPGWLVDWVLGGLNYQIEHHLFPSMPRANLKRAQPVVRAYCAGIGLPYRESGLLDSYHQALVPGAVPADGPLHPLGLGFRQSSFRHIARASPHTAASARTRSRLQWHAMVPSALSSAGQPSGPATSFESLPAAPGIQQDASRRTTYNSRSTSPCPSGVA